MTWHYRLVRDGEQYGIHEVYTEDGHGHPTSWTLTPVEFAGDTPEEVIESLTMALKDATNRDTLRVEGDKLVPDL